jgi:hypothetical protein
VASKITHDRASGHPDLAPSLSPALSAAALALGATDDTAARLAAAAADCRAAGLDGLAGALDGLAAALDRPAERLACARAWTAAADAAERRGGAA